MVTRTFLLRRYDDAWSFSARGRSLWKRAIPSRRDGILEGDGPPRIQAPIGPGEPVG